MNHMSPCGMVGFNISGRAYSTIIIQKKVLSMAYNGRAHMKRSPNPRSSNPTIPGNGSRYSKEKDMRAHKQKTQNGIFLPMNETRGHSSLIKGSKKLKNSLKLDESLIATWHYKIHSISGGAYHSIVVLKVGLSLTYNGPSPEEKKPDPTIPDSGSRYSEEKIPGEGKQKGHNGVLLRNKTCGPVSLMKGSGNVINLPLSCLN